MRELFPLRQVPSANPADNSSSEAEKSLLRQSCRSSSFDPSTPRPAQSVAPLPSAQDEARAVEEPDAEAPTPQLMTARRRSSFQQRKTSSQKLLATKVWVNSAKSVPTGIPVADSERSEYSMNTFGRKSTAVKQMMTQLHGTRKGSVLNVHTTGLKRAMHIRSKQCQDLRDLQK